MVEFNTEKEPPDWSGGSFISITSEESLGWMGTTRGHALSRSRYITLRTGSWSLSLQDHNRLFITHTSTGTQLSYIE